MDRDIDAILALRFQNPSVPTAEYSNAKECSWPHYVVKRADCRPPAGDEPCRGATFLCGFVPDSSFSQRKKRGDLISDKILTAWQTEHGAAHPDAVSRRRMFQLKEPISWPLATTADM